MDQRMRDLASEKLKLALGRRLARRCRCRKLTMLPSFRASINGQPEESSSRDGVGPKLPCRRYSGGSPWQEDRAAANAHQLGRSLEKSLGQRRADRQAGAPPGSSAARYGPAGICRVKIGGPGLS